MGTRAKAPVFRPKVTSHKCEKKLKRGFEEIKTCIALVGSYKNARVSVLIKHYYLPISDYL